MTFILLLFPFHILRASMERNASTNSKIDAGTVVQSMTIQFLDQLAAWVSCYFFFFFFCLNAIVHFAWNVWYTKIEAVMHSKGIEFNFKQFFQTAFWEYERGRSKKKMYLPHGLIEFWRVFCMLYSFSDLPYPLFEINRLYIKNHASVDVQREVENDKNTKSKPLNASVSNARTIGIRIKVS